MQIEKQQLLLRRVKILHTVVWVFFVGCILLIPVTAATGHFIWAAVCVGLVLLECLVLAFHAGRCPLTDVAARLTDDRSDNFDIYLPRWLARHNKAIFGIAFLAGSAFAVWSWMSQ